jgi:hypothetical protein
MLLRCVASLIVTALLSGCWGGLLGDSSNTHAYRISGTPTSTEREEVKSIVSAVARHTGYLTAQWPSWIPGGLAFYQSPPSDKYASYLGAHADGNSILVAVDGAFGPYISRVEKADARLQQELMAHFGSRVAAARDWKYTFAYRRAKTP